MDPSPLAPTGEVNPQTVSDADFDRLLHRSKLMDMASDVLLVIDNSGMVLDHNAAACRVHAVAGSLVGENVADYIHPDSHDDFAAFGRLAGEVDGTLRRRLKCLRSDGSILWLDVKAAWSATTQRFYLVERDVSTEVARTEELKEMSDRLTQQAHRDSLTGLRNRLAFDDRIAMPAPGDVRQWMVVADVDRFKKVNDTWGHTVGDALLCSIADRLYHQLRTGDFAARIGGDEFIVILMSQRDEVDISSRLKALQSSLSATHTLDCVELPVTCSLGAAESMPGEDGQSWYRRADQALYRSKELGRNQLQLDTPGNSAGQ